ncbi:MAG: hypothetical protein JSV04_05550, partial [Candidatus Heimdallarchaeota archaeon]
TRSTFLTTTVVPTTTASTHATTPIPESESTTTSSQIASAWNIGFVLITIISVLLVQRIKRLSIISE